METARQDADIITIRRADAGDMDWLVGQLKEFSKFFGSIHNTFPKEEYARDGMWKMITDHVVFVAQKAGAGPVGFISGYFTPHVFNPDIRVLAETFWWVMEEHRGSRAGLHLLNAFTAWGRENADWIIFTLEEKSPVNDSVLLRRGFRPLERNYMLEVE